MEVETGPDSVRHWVSQSKGWISFIQGVLSRSQNIEGEGCSSPNLRTGHLKMLESLEEALDPTLWFCDVCQLLRVWMSENGKVALGTWLPILETGDPPLRRNLGYLWGVRGDWTWAMGSTWVRPSPIFSHWLPSGAHSMTSGGQSTRVGTVTDLRVRKEHAWDLLLPLN